jgi:hypothetical protein
MSVVLRRERVMVRNRKNLQGMNIEVVEIYPDTAFHVSGKIKEQGTCHVRVKTGNLIQEIKNIRYQIKKNGSVWVVPPGQNYRNPKDKNKKLFVPTVTFENVEIWREIRERIVKGILKIQ